MTRYAHHVVIGAKETGYIKRDKLETFLEARFPSHQYPGAERNRFDLKETNDQWEFYAPELIPESAYAPLRKKN